jgi:hypothetical protein
VLYYLWLALAHAQEGTKVELQLVLHLVVVWIDEVQVELFAHDGLAEILNKMGSTSSILSKSNSFSKV